jgi:hypothetical protein
MNCSISDFSPFNSPTGRGRVLGWWSTPSENSAHLRYAASASVLCFLNTSCFHGFHIGPSISPLRSPPSPSASRSLPRWRHRYTGNSSERRPAIMSSGGGAAAANGVSPGNVPVCYYGLGGRVPVALERRVRAAEVFMRCAACGFAVLAAVLLAEDRQSRVFFSVQKVARYTDMQALV